MVVTLPQIAMDKDLEEICEEAQMYLNFDHKGGEIYGATIYDHNKMWQYTYDKKTEIYTLSNFKKFDEMGRRSFDWEIDWTEAPEITDYTPQKGYGGTFGIRM